MSNKQLELFSVDEMYGCIDVEDELVKSIDTLYARNVPSAVKEFLDMKKEPLKPKRQEVNSNG